VLAASNSKTYIYYVYKGNNPEVLKKAFEKRGNWRETIPEDVVSRAHFIWKPVMFNEVLTWKLKQRDRKKPGLIYNHFENIQGISTKQGLIKSLRAYYLSIPEAREAGYGVFDSTPTTFIVDGDLVGGEYKNFWRRISELQFGGYTPEEWLPHKHCLKNLWLVKPDHLN
jgi:hypothetical protein